MSLYEDFIAFVDADSYVKYFTNDAKYLPAPINYSIKFEFDFKIFYKTSNGCYVGVPFSSFVRKIAVKDFNVVYSRYNEMKEKRDFKKQLFFEF